MADGANQRPYLTLLRPETGVNRSLGIMHGGLRFPRRDVRPAGVHIVLHPATPTRRTPIWRYLLEALLSPPVLVVIAFALALLVHP